MEFKKLIEKEKSIKIDNIMIVDFLNLCFRCKHANKKIFAEEAVTTIASLAKSYKARDVVIAGDWGSAWRKNIYPLYKANRDELKANRTDQEREDFLEFLNEVSVAMELLKERYTVLLIKGVEADDIAAYIATRYSSQYEHTWLISTDRDWDLLISNRVSRFSYVSRKEVTLSNWGTYYDYDPEDHISVKVIQGDKGDNVPGVADIGAVRATSLIKEYGSAYDIANSLPIPSNYVYIKNLNEFGDQIFINYDIMDLVTNCHLAIGSEGCELIDSIFEE